MRCLKIFIGVASLVLAACGGPVAEPADIVYTNGTVLTMDDNLPTAEAVAVKDGRIVAVGPEAEVLEMAGDSTERIDLEGKTMLPGFVDSHGHAFGIGLQVFTFRVFTLKTTGHPQSMYSRYPRRRIISPT